MCFKTTQEFHVNFSSFCILYVYIWLQSHSVDVKKRIYTSLPAKLKQCVGRKQYREWYTVSKSSMVLLPGFRSSTSSWIVVLWNGKQHPRRTFCHCLLLFHVHYSSYAVSSQNSLSVFWVWDDGAAKQPMGKVPMRLCINEWVSAPAILSVHWCRGPLKV